MAGKGGFPRKVPKASTKGQTLAILQGTEIPIHTDCKLFESQGIP